MNLDIELRELAEGMGIDCYGVADLLPAQTAILDWGGPTIAEFPRAISWGIALPHAIVDRLPQRSEPAVAKSYTHHAYDIINLRLDLIASRLASAIQGLGYRAFPVAASQTVDRERWYAVFSHKMAAHLAGLGWIGKSCMLITPDRGPRCRWATVLTDTPLVPTGEAMKERCGACQECVDICPVNAYTGRPFREDEPREMRFAVHECERYRREYEKTTGSAVCGLCLYVCPHGRKARKPS